MDELKHWQSLYLCKVMQLKQNERNQHMVLFSSHLSRHCYESVVILIMITLAKLQKWDYLSNPVWGFPKE